MEYAQVAIEIVANVEWTATRLAHGRRQTRTRHRPCHARLWDAVPLLATIDTVFVLALRAHREDGREFLPQEAGCPVFVNADLIAAGLSPFAPERAALQAGRLTLAAIALHIAKLESFAFETTLSGKAYATQIPA